MKSAKINGQVTGQNDVKRTYSAPKLVRWGAIESLTQNGTSGKCDAGCGGGATSGCA